MIKELNSIENGYNIQFGGGYTTLGLKLSEETKKRMSEAQKGNIRHYTKEQNERMSIILTGKKHPHKGYPITEEHRLKMFKARMKNKEEREKLLKIV